MIDNSEKVTKGNNSKKDKESIIDARAKLIEDIFFKQRFNVGRSSDLNPISLLEFKKKLKENLEEATEEYQDKLNTYEKYLRIVEYIEKNGGLTKEFYDENHRLINSFIIDWKKLVPVTGGYDPVAEAEFDQSPTEEMIARFPEDGIHKNKNIFNDSRGQSRKGLFLHREEGILWQREFGEDKILSFIRIFHQVHRNTLIILTLNIDEFYAALMLYPLTIKPSLPEIVLPNEAMSPEEYKGTIDRFNQLFAPDMRIELGELTDHWGVSGQDSYLITTQATKSMDVRPHLIAVGDHNDIGKQLADSLKSELGSEEIIIRNNASDVKYMTIVELKSDFSKPFIVATCINDENRENSSQEEAVIILGEENQESIVQALLKYKK